MIKKENQSIIALLILLFNLNHLRKTKKTGHISIHPAILLLNNSLSLGFILRTVQNLLCRLRITDKSNHLECLQRLFLVQFRFPDLLVRVVNIFTDRANVLFITFVFLNGFLNNITQIAGYFSTLFSKLKKKAIFVVILSS
jgi:hypothetical protein